MRTQANIAAPMVRLVRLVDDCEETWRNREIFANSIQQTLDVWLNHFGSELGGQRVVFTWSTWNVPISKRSGALRKVHRRFLTRWENRSISQDTPTHTRSVNFSSWTFIFSHAERTHDCGKEPRRGPSCGPSCGLVFLTLLWTLPDVTNLQSALWFVLCLIACGWIQNASRSHKITSEQCWNIGELTHPSVCVCLISAFNGWTCSTDGHSMILRRMQNSWFLFWLMLWQMLNTGVQLLKPLPPKDTSAINLVLSLNPLPFISLDTSLTTVGSPLCILCNIRGPRGLCSLSCWFSFLSCSWLLTFVWLPLGETSWFGRQVRRGSSQSYQRSEMQWLDLWRYALTFHMLWQSGSDLISKTRTILGLVCTLEIDSFISPSSNS